MRNTLEDSKFKDLLKEEDKKKLMKLSKHALNGLKNIHMLTKMNMKKNEKS